jgi:hypothetical protein
MAARMVEFEEDESKILHYLRPLVKHDGCVVISDTALLQGLGMEEKRFFSAKNRLITGQVLAAWRETSGKPVLQLLVPEGSFTASKRYIFTILPLSLKREVDALKAEYRRRILPQQESRPPNISAATAPRHGFPSKRNYQREEDLGMKALGVRKSFDPYHQRKL